MTRFIEKAENLLPIKRDGMSHLYDNFLPYILNEESRTLEDFIQFGFNLLEWDDQAYLTNLVISTAIAYLAQRSNSSALNDLGYAAWNIIENRAVSSTVVNDLLRFAIELDFPIENMIHSKNMPMVFVRRKENPMKVISQNVTLAVPSDFSPFAFEHPVESLVIVAAVSSHLRDSILLPKRQTEGNSLFSIKAYQMRSSAAAAEVLLEAKGQNAPFRPLRQFKEILSNFPEGIRSLKPGIWYRNDPYFSYFDGDPLDN